MKPFDYYSKEQTVYPRKSDYSTYYAYDKGKCLDIRANFYTSAAELKMDYPNAAIQVVVDEESYKERLKEHNTEKVKLHREFRDDLFAHYRVTDNPKRFKCFELAWDNSHSCGLKEVYNYFGNLVQLIQD